MVPASAQKDAVRKLVKGTSLAALTDEPQLATVEPPDAGRTRDQFNSLLDRYPPTVRRVFKEDPTLMTPGPIPDTLPGHLVNFLKAHPEITLDPSFYLNGLASDGNQGRGFSRAFSMTQNLLRDLKGIRRLLPEFAIGLLTWFSTAHLFGPISQMESVIENQAEVHEGLLDQFGTNEELMAYITRLPQGQEVPAICADLARHRRQKYRARRSAESFGRSRPAQWCFAPQAAV